MDTNTVFFSIMLIIIICIVLLARHASKEDAALREDAQKKANELKMPVTLVLMANLNHRFVIGDSRILPNEIPLFTAYPMP
jgi:uncharacterized membrane protein